MKSIFQLFFQPLPQRPSKPAWAAPIPALCRSLTTLVCLGALAGFLNGCKKEPEKAVVLAQVGNSTLTLEELRESFPVEFEQLIRREQYLDFIKRWMDDEVVYQQALSAKLESDPVVGRKLAKLKRKLLIEEFLSKENAAEVFEPDEMAMNQYYEMHKEDFRRKVPEVKFAQIRVQTNKQAAELRSKAARGDFLALATANSLDPVPESYSSIAFKKQTDFPPCLSQDITGAGIGAVTLPVACPDGFYLVKVLERQDAGSLIPFAEAKEEISGILVMDRKDKLLEGRISKYKEGISVSYNLDQIPGLNENTKSADAPAASDPAAPAPAAPVAAPSAPTASAAASKPAAPQAASAVHPAPVKPELAAKPAAAPVKAYAAPVKTAGTAGTAPAAAASAADPRLPREPATAPSAAAMGGSSAGAPVQTAPGVGSTDPRMPREPWQDTQNAAPVKPKYPPRKRVKRPAADSTAAPKPASETVPETSSKTPDVEENTNAQAPNETP